MLCCCAADTENDRPLVEHCCCCCEASSKPRRTGFAHRGFKNHMRDVYLTAPLSLSLFSRGVAATRGLSPFASSQAVPSAFCRSACLAAHGGIN